MRIMMSLIFVLSLSLSLGKGYNFRVTQGLDEAHKAVKKAFDIEANEKAPYLYSKARSYKLIANELAAEVDDIGSKIFAIRTMNFASLAISAVYEGKENLTPLNEPSMEELQELFTKAKEFNVDLKSLKDRISFARRNKGEKCAPIELGKAEAFYDAFIYEISVENPNPALLLKFYNEANTESLKAEGKVKIAIENQLECYTGKPKEVIVPPVGKKEKPLKEKEEEKEKEEVVKKEVREERKVVLEKPEREKRKLGPVEEPLKIVARIHFDFDKYNIKREYIPILNEVVKTIKQNPYFKIRIEGFTDNIGPKDYNVRLARKRALSVKKYLVKHGVPKDKIEIVGFGKERYIAENTNPIGRLTNRRVEFIVIKVPGQP